MSSDDLITSVIERMDALRTTQAQVAKACGLSQPHLSKVLKKRVKLATKTTQRLTAWLEGLAIQKGVDGDEIIKSIASRLPALPQYRRMQIMQLLTAVDHLMDD